MLNSISERRVKLSDKYKLYIEIPDEEYLMIYNGDISVENARDVLWQYLQYHQDDARVENVEINHDRDNHSINIEADLIYVGNDYTTGRYRPNYLRTEKELEH
ncbi:hypothetical protein [Thermotalea metallivorans]|uniref:Uncharacterized protein n=1 Tax=Thermotalea metallivorans TaxID=520762 RepID=A0A140L1A3_9FIRM|nr:hypothetical protein [Thermotalea metallivorans]KXG74328.1 hypothetical protein AN619_24210 [Thermotalea metallivorans]